RWISTWRARCGKRWSRTPRSIRLKHLAAAGALVPPRPTTTVEIQLASRWISWLLGHWSGRVVWSVGDANPALVDRELLDFQVFDAWVVAQLGIDQAPVAGRCQHFGKDTPQPDFHFALQAVAFERDATGAHESCFERTGVGSVVRADGEVF